MAHNLMHYTYSDYNDHRNSLPHELRMSIKVHVLLLNCTFAIFSQVKRMRRWWWQDGVSLCQRIKQSLLAVADGSRTATQTWCRPQRGRHARCLQTMVGGLSLWQHVSDSWTQSIARADRSSLFLSESSAWFGHWPSWESIQVDQRV